VQQSPNFLSVLFSSLSVSAVKTSRLILRLQGR
jgi:hypothetical protein